MSAFKTAVLEKDTATVTFENLINFSLGQIQRIPCVPGSLVKNPWN